MNATNTYEVSVVGCMKSDRRTVTIQATNLKRARTIFLATNSNDYMSASIKLAGAATGYDIDTAKLWEDGVRGPKSAREFLNALKGN